MSTMSEPSDPMELTPLETILPERDAAFTGVPYPGCGATEHEGDESFPATIVEVSKATIGVTYKDPETGSLVSKRFPKTIHIHRDRHRLIAPNSERYVYYRICGEPIYPVEYAFHPFRAGYIRVGAPAKTAQRLGLGYRKARRAPPPSREVSSR